MSLPTLRKTDIGRHGHVILRRFDDTPHLGSASKRFLDGIGRERNAGCASIASVRLDSLNWSLYGARTFFTAGQNGKLLNVTFLGRGRCFGRLFATGCSRRSGHCLLLSSDIIFFQTQTHTPSRDHQRAALICHFSSLYSILLTPFLRKSLTALFASMLCSSRIAGRATSMSTNALKTSIVFF